MRISDGCDPNAHKLMKRSNHDFSQPTYLGHVIEAKSYKLDSTQRVIQSQGGIAAMLKVGLSYVLPYPMRISGWRKEKQALVQYITVKEIDDNEGKNAKTNPKTTMFDRLQPSTSSNALLCLQGLEMVKSWCPLPSIGWRRMSNLNPRSSPESR